jgi:hypothetical protein
MDVDLSTDLRGLLPLRAPLLSGHSEPDSRVRIVRTALDDLRGVARLAAAAPLARFLGIGVVSTLAFALLFLLLPAPRQRSRRPNTVSARSASSTAAGAAGVSGTRSSSTASSAANALPSSRAGTSGRITSSASDELIAAR